MKKLFISCPMAGREEKAIKRSMKEMHQFAEEWFGEKLEVLPSYIEEKPPEGVNEHIWYLTKSLEFLAQADYFIGIDTSVARLTGYRSTRGCLLESEIANVYLLPKSYFIRSYEFASFEDMKLY